MYRYRYTHRYRYIHSYLRDKLPANAVQAPTDLPHKVHVVDLPHLPEMAKDGVALLTRQRHATHAQAVGKRRPRKPVLYITHICVSIHMYIYIHECTDRYIIFAYIYMWLVCRPPVRVWRGADCMYISISTYVYTCVYIHTYIHIYHAQAVGKHRPRKPAVVFAGQVRMCVCICVFLHTCRCGAGPYVRVCICVFLHTCRCGAGPPP